MKQLIRWLSIVVAIIVLVSHKANAQYTVDYFSGTNAETGMGWYFPSPSPDIWFSEIQIRVKGTGTNGIAIDDIVHQELMEDDCQVISWQCNFDSTDFRSGTVVTVESIVFDNFGNRYSVDIKGRVINRYYAFRHQDNSPDPLLKTFRLAAENNYAAYMNPNGVETESKILSKITSGTFLYFATHGCEDGIATSHAPTVGAAQNEFIYASEIGDAISRKTQAKYPPVSLAFLWSCNTLGTQGQMAYKIPNGFGITSSSINQAYVGFADLCLARNDKSEAWCNDVMSGLLSKRQSIGTAMDKASQSNYPVGLSPDFALPGNDVYRFFRFFTGGYITGIKPETVGDRKTKVRGLYLEPANNPPSGSKRDWCNVKIIGL